MDYLNVLPQTQKAMSVDTPNNLLTDLLEIKDLLDQINNLTIYEKTTDNNGTSHNTNNSSTSL